MQSRLLVPARTTTARIWEGWNLSRYTQKRNLGSPEARCLLRVTETKSVTLAGGGIGIRAYLGHLKRTKFLAPPEPDLERDDLDEEDEEEPWPAHPVVGAQELLRYSRVRQLLQD